MAADNQQVVDDSDVVVVCLLPNHAAEVLAGLQFRANHAVVSAIAGFPVARLAGLVAPATDIARSIPAAAARRYVADTFAALSGELDSPGADFAALAQAHTTPGGLNEQFARDLDAAGTYDAVQAGLDALLARIAQK